MRSIYFFLKVGVFLVATVAARTVSAMDFSPRQARMLEDGVPSIRNFFKDGNTNILFRPAKGWRMAGGGNEVMFYPGALNGYIRLGNSPVGPAVPFDEKGILTYLEAARGTLPKQAENVETLSQQGDAYPLDDWKSFEVRYSYELLGIKSVCWVLFITMTPDRQICYAVDGRQSDFDAILADSRQMLGSWFEPPAGLLSLAR